METSDKGLALIMKHEGFQSKAYRCPAGVWTIGYGHTRNVREGQTCTEAHARKWLTEDVASAEREVSFQTSGLKQCQFDALVSFVFNMGAGNFRTSTLLKKVKVNPDNPTIREEFEKWIYGGGRVLPGLVARREDEADMYFGET